MTLSALQFVGNHVWQSTVFAAVAGLLTLALRRNRAQVRYGIWVAASLKFLVPFSILVGLGRSLGQHAAVAVSTSDLSFAIVQVGVPFAVSSPVAAATAVGRSFGSWIPALLCGVWVVGFVMLVCSWYWRWRRVRAAVRMASPVKLDIGIEVLTSPAFGEPGVFGVWRPVLMLPAGISDRLTEAQFDAILAHELCHVRRRDNLVSAIHMIVEAVFWFHPLVWWLGARLMEERERACDEEVLRMGSEPEVYAEGILKICELYLESPLQCLAGVTGGSLKKRIEAIMANRVATRLSFGKMAVLAVAGLAALASPIVMGVVHAPPSFAQSVSAAQSVPAAAAPKFDVASVRRCSPADLAGHGGRGGGAGGLTTTPGRLTITCMSVVRIINLSFEYGDDSLINDSGGPFEARRIRGGPEWIQSDLYTIEAATENPIANGPTGGPGTRAHRMLMGPMLRELMKDRFQLKTRIEVENIPMYALTAANTGLRMQPTKEGDCIRHDPTQPILRTAPGGNPACSSSLSTRGPNLVIDEVGQNLSHLAGTLSLAMDRHVIDKTGIEGMFTVHLEFARDESAPFNPPPGFPPYPIEPSDIPLSPSVFTVLEQETGLKLVRDVSPHGYVVIDHIEKPSEN